MMNRKGIIIGILTIGIAALITTAIVQMTNSYPTGSDVYGHLFKIKTLYEEIQNGNYYPIYTTNWYSGIELFRYWPPLSYYFVCIFMFMTGADIYKAFLIFIFAAYFIGGCGWLLFGYREKRIPLSIALGVIYFLLPDNMRAFFEEGNIPRVFITMLLPWVFFFVFDYLYHNKKKALIPLNLLIVLCVATHIMISAMLGISIFFVCFFYSILNKEIRREIILLTDAVLGYVECGIILLPGLMGGIVTQGSSAAVETSASWSQLAVKSLNPFIRFNNLDLFYFGLSLFLIIIIGLWAMRKKTAPCFATGLLIFIGTTMIVLPILSALPLGQVLWMMRFVPMAEVVTLVGFIYWDRLKKWAVIAFLAVIILDSSISLRYITIPMRTIDEREENAEKKILLDDALDIVDNRLALMDLSLWHSYPTYALIKNGRDADSLFGWSYQGAYTIKEIVSLNEAFEDGFYDYVFDRLYIYGCDTVLVKRDLIIGENGEEKLLLAARAKGYELMDYTEACFMLKHNIVDGKYGVVLNHENVCIGKGSEYLSYLYPDFYKLANESLDDYTFEDLKDYKKIYLSGPTYDDKQHAEQLVQELSDHGVKIFIDMNALQEDKSIGRNSFLGVVAQPITFTDSFPIIEKENKSQFKLPFYSDEYSAWRTVYFTNLETVTRKTEYKKGKYLDYLGTSPNENITYIGLNLVYYCRENSDNEDLYEFLDEIFEESRSETPNHTYVPLDINIDKNNITIETTEDNVMTNLANLDSFVSEKELGNERFVSVNEGITNIRIIYAYFKEGLICSVLGIVICILFYIYLFKVSKENVNEEEKNSSGVGNSTV